MPESFTCEACGYSWFVEERVIRLAGSPSEIPNLKSAPSEVVYRLRCFNCGRYHYPGGEPVQKKGAASGGKKQKARA